MIPSWFTFGKCHTEDVNQQAPEAKCLLSSETWKVHTEICIQIFSVKQSKGLISDLPFIIKEKLSSISGLF